MENELQQTIGRAKELLATVRHAAMATVNEDCSPHNTPFRVLFDKNLEYFYWASYPEALHSENVMRTKRAFVVLYDANEKGGLYVRLENIDTLSGDDLAAGVAVHSAARVKEGKGPITIEHYSQGKQRLYRGTATKFWVNVAERDASGFITRDYREEITAQDLR